MIWRAEAKADFVRRTGARVTLPPMSPYFRRIVHTHVAVTPSLSDLTTESVGEGDYRQIVIRLKTAKKNLNCRKKRSLKFMKKGQINKYFDALIEMNHYKKMITVSAN